VKTGTQGRTGGARLKASDPIYGDILDFFIDEAALLDDDRHVEWLDCLTDDIVYQMPVRKTVYRRNGDGFDGRNSHWDDNRQSLGLRVKRSVDLASAFDATRHRISGAWSRTSLSARPIHRANTQR